jgi:hypothetical protein
VRVSLPVEMRRARAFGDPSRRDKEHHRASRKCRRESTVQYYAAVDRAGVALASTRYLTTPWVRPVADLIIAK